MSTHHIASGPALWMGKPAAGRPVALGGKLVDRETKRAVLPCGSCKLCCHLFVPLADEEFDRYAWAWIEKDGRRLGRTLQRRPDGSCVYLGDSGCTIWDRAPHVCQRFDCRDVLLKWNRNERRHMINTGQLPKAIFVRGREMLEAMK